MLIGTFLLFHSKVRAQTTFDSLGIKQAKHYFKTTIFTDSYSKANQEFDGSSNDTIIDQKIKSFGLKQLNIGFYTPIHTKIRLKPDSTVYSNTHYLITGNFLSVKPLFNGIESHTLLKVGAGLRIIHNTGKKGVWFIDIQPFVTKDITTSTPNGYWRMANSFIYSHNFSDAFNMRLGITKSFLWGNRNYWPYFGLRWGRLDRVYFSMQFPKNISLNVPVGQKVRLSLFSRPQGGMYTFLNNDSLLYYRPNTKSFNLTHYELLTGLRVDVVFSAKFAAYLSFGSTTRNNITFYAEEKNSSNPGRPYRVYFFERGLKPTGFLNFGLVYRFGKTRSFYNDRNLYDVMDINASNPGGDQSSGPASEIPFKKSLKRSKLNMADIQDLIDINDN